MRIAHISDLHICTSNKRNNIRHFKFLLEYISASKFDHLIITGDLTDNAERKDFEVIRKLLDKYGYLSNDKLSVVIGNHDIFGGVHKAEDIFKFPAKCMKVDYKNKVKEFGEYFVEAFWNTEHPSDNDLFPFVKELGDVILVGLNSIDYYSKITNPFASNGYVSKKQYNNLLKIFSDERFSNKIKIVMIHHHFYKHPLLLNGDTLSFFEKIEKYTTKLRGKKKLFKLFNKNNVKLVLHGHMHESCEYIRKGIRFLNAGSSVMDRITDQLNINEIDIDNNQITVNVKSLFRTNNFAHIRHLEPAA